METDPESGSRRGPQTNFFEEAVQSLRDFIQLLETQGCMYQTIS